MQMCVMYRSRPAPFDSAVFEYDRSLSKSRVLDVITAAKLINSARRSSGSAAHVSTWRSGRTRRLPGKSWPRVGSATKLSLLAMIRDDAKSP